jgi:hypothetical protein
LFLTESTVIVVVKPFDYGVIRVNNYVRGNRRDSTGYTYRLFLSKDIMDSGGTQKYHGKYQENKIYVQTGRQII